MMFNDGNQTDFVNGTFTVLSSLAVDKLFESSCKWTASFYSSPLNGASFWRISSSFSLVRGILQEPRLVLRRKIPFKLSLDIRARRNIKNVQK